MTDNIETTAPPIEAHATPLPDQLWAGLRQIVPPATTYLLAKGFIDNDLVLLLTALVGVVWPIVAGQIKTRRRAMELTTVAADPRVPEYIARLKT